ncbi:MAG: ABC transporter permease [Armatimonadetes bacterium]|nr:ABC transporter permease [Armatimonadota bacterium]
MKLGVQQVFLKELREMARDKRVLQGALVMPVFIIALFVLLMGVISSSITESRPVSLALVETDNQELREQLSAAKEFEITWVESMSQAEALVREKAVNVGLKLPPASAPGSMEPLTAELALRKDEPLSAIDAARVRAIIDANNKVAVGMMLESQGINKELAEPIRIKETDLSVKEGLGGSQIVDLLPYLIVLWAFYGGMSIVADLVAGEKERGTMETLLISPVRRAAVALGKILALMVVCFVSAMTTLIGVFSLGLLKLEITKNLFPSGLSISFANVVIALGMLIALVAFFSALMVAVSAYARNIREAQTYLGALSFLVLLPAVFSQVIGFTGAENAKWVAWTPILNTAVGLRGVIKGEPDLMLVTGSVVSSLVLAFLFLRIAMQLFRREEIVLRV